MKPDIDGEKTDWEGEVVAEGLSGMVVDMLDG